MRFKSGLFLFTAFILTQFASASVVINDTSVEKTHQFTTNLSSTVEPSLLSLVSFSVTFDSVQTGGWDGYIHLYEGAFDPLNQLAGLIGGDDDGPGGIGTSQIVGISLNVGTTYYLVTSGFAAGDAGPYQTVISGFPGGPLLVNGDTTGGPTWDRPVGGGPGISGLGPVNFDAVAFTIPEPSTASMIVLGLACFIARRNRPASPRA